LKITNIVATKFAFEKFFWKVFIVRQALNDNGKIYAIERNVLIS